MERQYLSIDIGGTSIKYAQINHSGNIIEKDSIETPRSKEEFLRTLENIFHKVPAVTAICVSVPGIVNSQSGLVQFTGILKFMGKYKLGKFIEDTTDLPWYVGNDANCATLAELWLGNLNGIENGAVITLGTSVGGGIVVNGRLLHGLNSRAGELSAIITNRSDPEPTEQTVGATTSAVKMVQTIADVCDLQEPDGRQVFEQINTRNPLAWSLFEQYCRRVAILLINLQAVLDLETILIGGGISVQPILITEIKEQFAKMQARDQRLADDVVMPEIEAAMFGNEANLLGALYGLFLKIDR